MRIRVVGAGVMGRGIAQWAVTAGHTVELGDARRESVDEAVAFVRQMLDRAAGKGSTSAGPRRTTRLGGSSPWTRRTRPGTVWSW